MVGTNGLPTALSQTWCSDDSISFESNGMRSYQVAVRMTVGIDSDCFAVVVHNAGSRRCSANVTIWPCTQSSLAPEKRCSEI